MPNHSHILPIVFESVIIFQIIYIALQWLYFFRRKEYLYYLGYMFSIGLYIYFLYQDVFPIHIIEHPAISLDKALPMLGYLFYYRFARQFIDMQFVFPKLNKWIKLQEYLLLVYIVFEISIQAFDLNKNISEIIFNVISSILFVLTFVFIYIFLQKKIKLTYFLVAGAAVLTVGSFATMVLIVMQQSGQPVPFDPFWPFVIATIFDLVAFTTGLAYKSKMMVNESLNIQIEYNKKLNQNMVLNQQLHEIKESLAQRLHSDLITAFSNINIFSGLAKKEITAGDTSKTLQHLNKISQTGTNEIQRINDLVWCANPAHNTLEQLQAKLISIWAEGESTVPLQIQVQENCPPLDFDVKLLMEIIRLIRKIKEQVGDISPEIKLACADENLQVGLHYHILGDEIFIEDLEPYFISTHKNPNGSTSVKITTIRD